MKNDARLTHNFGNWLLVTILTVQMWWLLLVTWQPTGELLSTIDLVGIVVLSTVFCWYVRRHGRLAIWQEILIKVVVGLWLWQIVVVLSPLILSMITPVVWLALLTLSSWGQKWRWNLLSRSIFSTQAAGELVAVLILIWGWRFPSLLQTCDLLIRYDFDPQNFSTWVYTAMKGYMPYRDVFYWYGLLLYYYPAILWVRVVYVIWICGLFTGMYWLLRQIISHTLLRLWAFGLAVIMIDQLVGLNAFARYGSGMVVAVIGAWGWMSLSGQYRRWWLAGLGLVAGSLFFLIQDQGLYITLTILGMGVAVILIRLEEWRQSDFWIDILKQTVSFIGGWLIAALPFGFWLLINDSWNGYLTNLALIGQMSSFAKKPFFGSYNDLSNLFVTVSIGILGIDLAYRYLFERKSLRQPQQFIKIAFLGIITFFQYKNSVRPLIADQFIVTSWIVFWLYLSELYLALKQSVKPKVLLVGALMMISLVALFLIMTPQQLRVSSQAFPLRLTRDWSRAASLSSLQKNHVCQNYNFGNLIDQAPPSYQQVVSWLRVQPDFTGRIFSYPADPVFYMLLEQLPAPYFNAYDATSELAQELNLKYLQQPDLQYVVLNTHDPAIQDGVPNVLRNQLLNKYLYTNFQPVAQFGKFLILRKSTQRYDFMAELIRSQHADFMNSQLILNFNHLPQMEASNVIKADKPLLMTATSSAELSDWLVEQDQIPAKFWLVLKPDDTQPQTFNVAFVTKDDFSTEITMTNCANDSPCAINISRIPLFFWPDRRIKAVTIISEQDTPWKGEIFYNETYELGT